MTNTERDRIKAICEVAGVKEIDDLSDGFHTFRQLYYQRMMLFATIVKQNKDKAWKSLRHEDGELCFGGGWFIVGIDTPEGSYTYHYEDNYFSLFDCEELECGKHWDGHTEKDVIRLLSLPSAQPEQVCVAHITLTDAQVKEAVEKAKNAVISVIKPDPPWIPCSKTIDIPDHQVLCCDKHGEELIGWLSYNDVQWFCESNGEMMYDTIAWREKPEPYEGELE